MRRVVKLRVANKRLSLGSWSISFALSLNSPTPDSKRQSRSHSSMAVPIIKELEPSTTNGSFPDGTATIKTQSKTSSLIELAATITREAEKLNNYLKESGDPFPSFDVDGPSNFPKLPDEIQKSREEVWRATNELGQLVTGPTEILRWMAWDVSKSIPDAARS